MECKNGAEHLQSLRDGRTVYLDGKLVDDVTTHPAYRNAIASAVGRSSCNSSTRFGPRTLRKALMPVTLPFGRLRLSTRPTLIGSAPIMKTIGIVSVAAFAANADGTSGAKIAATLRPTSSAAREGKRS